MPNSPNSTDLSQPQLDGSVRIGGDCPLSAGSGFFSRMGGKGARAVTFSGWFRLQHATLALVLLLAIAVRLANLDRSLWDDEIYTVYDASAPFGTILSNNITPLCYLFTKVPLILGNGELLLRLPFVFAGLAALLLLYGISTRIAGPVAGITAALFLALAPYHVVVSQEVRFYGLVCFFGLLALSGFERLCGRVSAPGMALLVLGSAGALLTHLSAVFFAVPLLACSAVAVFQNTKGMPLSRRIVLAVLPLALSGVVAALPLLANPDRLRGLAVIIGVLTPTDVESLPRLSVTYHLDAVEYFRGYLGAKFLSAVTMPEIILTGLVAVMGLVYTARRRPLLALFFVCMLVAVPLLLTWIPARQKWAFRYFAFALPVLLLLLALGLRGVFEGVRVGISRFSRHSTVSGVLAALLCALLVLLAQTRELRASQAGLPVTDMRALAHFVSPYIKMGGGRHLFCYLNFDNSPSGGTHVGVPFQYYMRSAASDAFLPLLRRVEGLDGLRELRCQFPDTHLWVLNCDPEIVGEFEQMCDHVMPWSPKRWADLSFGVIAPATVNLLANSDFETFDEDVFRTGPVSLSPASEAWRGDHALRMEKTGKNSAERCEVQIPIRPARGKAGGRLFAESEPHTLSLMLRYHIDHFGPQWSDGVRVLLQTRDENGTMRRQELFRGRYHSKWRRLVFPLREGANIPADLIGGSVCIALEGASGRVWVDDVQLEAKPSATFFTNNFRPEPDCL